jgi:hypothetical protein
MAKSDGLGDFLKVVLVAVGTGVAVGGAAAAYGAYRRRRSRDGELLMAARAELLRAAALLGVEAPPLVASRQVSNAASNGRVILINPDWIRGVLAHSCSDSQCSLALLLGIAAHELAHHLNRDALRAGDSWAKELAADKVAGAVLAREGASVCDFERVIGELSKVGSRTHPDGDLRREAIHAGYQAAIWGWRLT